MGNLHRKFTRYITWKIYTGNLQGTLHGKFTKVSYMVELLGDSASESDSKIFSMVSNTISSWTGRYTSELTHPN